MAKAKETPQRRVRFKLKSILTNNTAACFSRSSAKLVKIKMLQGELRERKRSFGLEYVYLKKRKASDRQLKCCVAKAQREITDMENEILSLMGEVERTRETTIRGRATNLPDSSRAKNEAAGALQEPTHHQAACEVGGLSSATNKAEHNQVSRKKNQSDNQETDSSASTRVTTPENQAPDPLQHRALTGAVSYSMISYEQYPTWAAERQKSHNRQSS
jgi:hypothetical protein